MSETTLQDIDLHESSDPILANQRSSSMSTNQEQTNINKTVPDYSSGSTPSGESPPLIHLNLRTLTGQMMVVELPHTPGLTNVLNLKQAVEATHGIPVSFQRLIFAGRELQDANTLVSYGIEDTYTVHLLLRQNQPTPEQQAAYAAQTPQMGNPGMQGVIAIPIQAMPVAISPEAAERMTITYQLGRYVKMFAVIDAIFAVIWSFNFWPAAIGVFLAICGYYGAQNYQRKFVALYALYLLLSIALRIYWLTLSQALIYMFILGIGIIIELYILHLVWRFIKIMKPLTYDERMELIAMRHRGGFMG